MGDLKLTFIIPMELVSHLSLFVLTSNIHLMEPSIPSGQPLRLRYTHSDCISSQVFWMNQASCKKSTFLTPTFKEIFVKYFHGGIGKVFNRIKDKKNEFDFHWKFAVYSETIADVFSLYKIWWHEYSKYHCLVVTKAKMWTLYVCVSFFHSDLWNS